ncbi:MAG: winged helix-turn-helix domain-containing protein [Gammaproteobacteria bacterium]|nr:winged helix-turn-helix domain-containing protein [Gammaproteobacteria bacterium]
MKEENKNVNYLSGDLTIEPSSGMVNSSIGSVHLSVINMSVMLVLLESNGEVISRNEIFDKVWKNQLINDDVLTRCISNLRSQLSQITHEEELIETLPKRGYRWKLAVQKSDKQEMTSSKPELSEQQNINNWGVSIILFLCLFVLFGLQLNKSMEKKTITVAILPIQIIEPDLQDAANKIDELLRAGLIETSRIKLLARSAVLNHTQLPLTTLSMDYNAQWIIETHISSREDNNIRIFISVIDAKTAMVEYTYTESAKPDELKSVTNELLRELITLLPKD